jgi:predicted Rossmann fold flavoprotein
MKVAIIGGGAAGFFAAISCKAHHPDAQVTIYEKSGKLLSKVKVSGGSRCNVTHACFSISQLAKFYPRGEKQLKKAFGFFNTNHTVEWFESRGVELKTEADNRMFPTTDNSQTIIDCLMGEAEKTGVIIKLNSPVNSLAKKENGFELKIKDQLLSVDKVIVATGGSPKLPGYDWLKELGHTIVPPVPSLFTFNMPQEPVKELMGVVADPVSVRIQGTKLKSEGPLLITHWGMSGPAILKLSAFGARTFHDLNYEFKAQINWLGPINEEELRKQITSELTLMSKRKLANKNPFEIPNRLWLFLLNKLEINPDITWEELGKKNRNRLLNTLLNDVYQVKGKTTFKEEFVTCGGIALQNVSMRTMESKPCPGLYFAGEVLDIDGVTGGFNFQAAWTTGFLAGKVASE